MFSILFSQFNKLQSDDKAIMSRKISANRTFNNHIVELPTYMMTKKRTKKSHWMLEIPDTSLQHPLTVFDILHQIADDLAGMRLLIFEIARLGSMMTRLWGRSLKLTGPALALDKRICIAHPELIELANSHQASHLPGGLFEQRIVQRESAQGK